MAPNKKKKKVTNPARGFATTSQPSKNKMLTATEDEKVDLLTDELHKSGYPFNETHTEDPSRQRQPSLTATDPINEMSPEELEAHLEDADLQNLINVHAARCKADASRQLNRLATERRQLRSQSHRLNTGFWLPEDIVDDVLKKYAQHQELRATTNSSVHVQSDETTLLLRLWTLQNVLVTLQLPDVEVVIRHVIVLMLHDRLENAHDYIWGLQSAFEWYAMHGNPEYLPDYENGKTTVSNQAPEALDDELIAEKAPNKPKSETELAARTGTSPTHLSDQEGLEHDISPIPTSGSEDEDPSTFADSYLRLQTLLFHTEERMKISDHAAAMLQSRKARLTTKLKRLTGDVLFDEEIVESLWRPKLQGLQIDAAKSSKKRNSAKQASGPCQSSDVQPESVLPEDNGDMLGDIFRDDDVLQNDKIAETSNIQHVDFGKWSGMSPRKLLEEICHALDNQVKVRFSTLSTTSYSTRQRLDIIWSFDIQFSQIAVHALPTDVTYKPTLRRLAFEMSAIAASTPSQAEAYLSTLALFLMVSSKIGDLRQVTRLPTVWRNLFQDLDDRQKHLIEIEDKRVLRELRTIAHAVLQPPKADDLPHSAIDGQKNVTVQPSRPHFGANGMTEDEARAQWFSRALSPSYGSILQIREQLPVHGYKMDILTAIQQNQLVVICAETGAGKSTQVPSFVLEHELSNGRDCRILVTQPRRISAITLASRVSQELGEARHVLGTDKSLVGYAIRLESKISKSTRLTFSTTGVLLRMIESTPNLEDIDYLILDEVHERTMDLDLLFIALRKLQARRSSLKLVLMSATIDAQKFSDYFGGAPILNLPGRTFPVQVRYLEDAIEETLDIKEDDITAQSSKEDEGGYQEDVTSDGVSGGETPDSGLDLYSSKTRLLLSQMDEYRIEYDLVANLAVAIATKDKYAKYNSAILIFMPGIAEIIRLRNVLLSRNVFARGWEIHMLHSSFSTEDLERAFAVPATGYHKIVIATNIAETGITIPDVTAVIDTCKEKIMRFDERRQLSRLTESFISRSSARQRKGRAARVQEGLCFHLVTKHRYENVLLEQHVPEMLRLSLQDPILRIKVWNLGSIEETLSAAIDPPTHKNINRATERLKDAGALDSSEDLTPLGRQIARLPLEVVLGKLACFGIIFKCLDAAITMIASLTSKSPFLSNRSNSQNNTRLPFLRGDSDLLSTLNACQGWRKAKESGMAHQYCRKHHLDEHNLSSIEDQKVQLLVYLVDAGLLQLNFEEQAALKKARTPGPRKTFFIVPERYNAYETDQLLSSIIAMAFYPRVLVREGKGWTNVYTNQRVGLTPGSVNRTSEKPPKWLCFYEALQTKTGALNVLETSRIPEATIAISLGECEFKYYSGVIGIDNGRLRFSLRQWRYLAAVKAIRKCLGDVMHRCWQSPNLAVSRLDQIWVETFATIVAGGQTRLR